MQHYRNTSGNSGVLAYNYDEDSINVMFSDGSVYKYSYRSAGENTVEELKRLADLGSGLNSYINRFARKSYESKSRR